MKDVTSISSNLFDKIRSQFPSASISDKDANATSDPKEAKFYNFDFDIDGQSFGNITISISDGQSLKVFFSSLMSENLPDELKPKWFDFLKSLRFFAKRNLLTFDTHDITRSKLRPRDIKTMSSQQTNLLESWYGTKTRSYQTFGECKIIVSHTRAVDETKRGSRSRNIAQVFVENALGERFLMPFVSLSGTRAMSRHIANGGSTYDSFGKHITQLVEELKQLKKFSRLTSNYLFEDPDACELQEQATKYCEHVYQTLGSLKSQRFYTEYKNNWQNIQIDEVASNISQERFVEMFSRKTFRDSLLDCMPAVTRAKAYAKQYSVVEEFSQWVDQIEEEQETSIWQDFFQEKVLYGDNGENALAILNNYDAPEELRNYLSSLDLDPESDIRQAVYDWLQTNDPATVDSIEFEPVKENVRRGNKQEDFVSDVEFDRSDDQEEFIQNIK